ncbi:bombyxin A-3-like isoform X3 [Stegodyphus dumicola]|uniref:bombyxin A-3-like isoform X3 n=1 Tax=Stegodyphus dumicola TaxID=202533 RepID=UPI0015AF87FF|nr:bombyxin A-3-like isoform X3 [Stegodyphus dumicola]
MDYHWMVSLKSVFMISMVLMSLVPWTDGQHPQNITECRRWMPHVLSAICRQSADTPIANEENNEAFEANEQERFLPEWMNNIDPGLAWFFGRSEPSEEHKIRSRDVADECCDKTCTYETLLSYCPPTDSATDRNTKV